MNIGQRITWLLQKRGMTQRELANRIGATEVSVSRYITGARMPKANIIVYMADELNTTTDYIIGRIDDETGTGDKELRRPADVRRDH